MKFEKNVFWYPRDTVHLLGTVVSALRDSVRPSALTIAHHPVTNNTDPLLSRHSVSRSRDPDSAPLTDFATHFRML